MGSVTRVLQNARLSLRYAGVGRLLRRLGITSLVRELYVRKVLQEGTLSAHVLGTDLAFKIQYATEITRVDTIERELDFLRRILASVKPGDTVFDVGANVGTVSLLLAKLTPGARVDAFEPEPQNAERLRENIALNSIKNVNVQELALAASSGSFDLHVHGVTGTGSHSLVANSQEEDSLGGGKTVVVSTIRGEEFIARSGIIPNVMKIDVEGAEFDVLSGFGVDLGNQTLRDVFIEVHPTKLAMLGMSARNLHELMEGFGFRQVWSAHRGSEEHRHYSRGHLSD